jgi:hypothetical protein
VRVAAGDILSIDGEGGLVVSGRAPVKASTPPAEIGSLLEWADRTRKLRVDALVTAAGEAAAGLDAGADGTVVRVAVGSPRAADLLAEAAEAVQDRPMALWVAGQPGARSEEWLAELLGHPAAARLEAVLAAPAFTAGAAFEVAINLDRGQADGERAGLAYWESPAGESNSAVPAGAKRLLMPDAEPGTFDSARALGVDVLVAPSARIAGARLGAAQAELGRSV